MKYIYLLVNYVKLVLNKFIPTKLWLVVKPMLLGRIFYIITAQFFTKEWQAARGKSRRYPVSKKFDGGINLVGYFRAVKGIGEAARGSALALESARIPYSVVDYELGIPMSQQVGTPPVSQGGTGFKFSANLIHVNPPQLPFLWSAYKKEDLACRYNIGVWYWELPEFPDEWRQAFGLVDEIWVATQFIFDGLTAKAHIPVVKIPPCVNPVFDQSLKRSDYNLPADCFLFMCAYDVLSVQARKNPLGAIDAFQRAFSKKDSSVGLVIKVNNAKENPREIKQLYSRVDGYSNCYIIDDVFDKPKFNSLLNMVDAYVSLHRSEGFGLIPAEAMSFGKPVIMTRWSGNVDFMTSNNSCGVDYQLVPVGKNAGPYLPGQLWAEPDIDQAAFFMQRLISDKDFSLGISEQAKRTIQENYSPEHVGALIKNRMRKIGLIS